MAEKEKQSFPDGFRKVLLPFLAPDETLLFTLPTYGPKGIMSKSWECWAILTPKTFFHMVARPLEKPEIGAIPREKIKKVVFAPTRRAVTLTFYPRDSESSFQSHRVDFPPEQRTEVNKLSEELWKTIDIEVLPPRSHESSAAALESVHRISTFLQREKRSPERSPPPMVAPPDEPQVPLPTPASVQPREIVRAPDDPSSKTGPAHPLTPGTQSPPPPFSRSTPADTATPTGAENPASEGPSLPKHQQRMQNRMVFFSSLLFPLLALFFFLCFHSSPEED